jgi:hypothetical protein
MNKYDDQVSELLEVEAINDIFWPIFNNEKNRIKGFEPVALVVAILISLVIDADFCQLQEKYIKLTNKLPKGSPYLVPIEPVPADEAHLALKKYLKHVEEVDALNLEILETALKLHRAGKLILSPAMSGLAERLSFEMMPSGPGSGFLKSVITNAQLERELERKNIIYKTRETLDGKWVAEYKSANASYKVTVENERFRKLTNASNKQSANTRKVFNYLLTKSNEQHFSPDISFHLQDLVDRGIYKTKHSAYKGVKHCIDTLMGFEIEGSFMKGKREVRNIRSYVFVARDISFSVCKVKTMPGTLENLCPYFAKLNPKIYALSGKSYLLAEYIHTAARFTMHQENIAKRGHFNISLKTINQELAQKSPDQTEHHTQMIIQPILKAIDEVNGSDAGVRITPKHKREYRNAYEFLEGHVEVVMPKDITEYSKKRIDIKREKIAAKKGKRSGNSSKKGDK